MKRALTAIIFSIAIVIAAYLLGNAVINRNKANGTISVTGLGKADFISDLIVWEGYFNAENTDLKQAYADLENDKEIITNYLASKGIKTENIIFNAINTSKNTRSNYAENGRYLGEDFLGYTLSQAVTIESKDVESVEAVSREITELLNQGVQFYSNPPRYYYTKLAELKIEMISKATADARMRAEEIAEHSGGDLGDLLNANMGVFQITGQNSNEEFSWGGTYNVSDRAKTATVTMKLTYDID